MGTRRGSSPCHESLLAHPAAGTGHCRDPCRRLFRLLGRGTDGGDRPVTLYGNVEIREAELAFEVSGRLATIRVAEGDRVAQGELLAEIDDRRLGLAVAEAGARIAAQRQRVQELERGSRPQEIRRARAELEAARAEHDNARSDLKRLRGLAENQQVSRQRIDDAETALESARARVRKARESLELAEKGPREDRIATAKAKLEAQEAALANHREDLADTELHAPAPGIVRNRLMEPGEMASPQVPALTLALRDRVWVRAFLPEPRLGRVAPGRAAVIRTDTFPDRSFPARVGHISPTAEFTPKTVQTTEVRPDLVSRVRINACEPFDALRLGMPVTVKIQPNDLADAACP
ncbi:efflux RND transporter periplasmic adaptor subunit [Thiohalorhabdus sp.]|uniref:efflux RND transporter periplasmic adaptor subunit n=1 Tax=Thiohalorhabdus sp. TaxID=3094134 RepID=UPI002FC2B077